MAKLSGWVCWLLVGVIQLYQSAISPYLGGNCRFRPTCSTYTIRALRQHGVVQGVWLGACRLLQCHPLSSKNGWDPVPDASGETEQSDR